MLPQQNRARRLNVTYFSYNHSSSNKSAKLSKRQALAGQRTVKLLLVFDNAHNPINNPAVQIADPGKQNTLLLVNYTTNRRTISHPDGHVSSYHHDTLFQQYIPRGIIVRVLFCLICQILPVWLHYTMFRRLCCFRLTAVLIQTHYLTFQDINLQPYFKTACVKSVLWSSLVSNVFDGSRSAVGVWVIEHHVIMLSATVCSPTDITSCWKVCRYTQIEWTPYHF